MLDMKFIRENEKTISENCENRGVQVNVGVLITLDEERRSLLCRAEEKRAQRKKKSKGKPTEEEIANLKNLGQEIKDLEDSQKEIEERFLELLCKIPNLTHPDVLIGEEGEGKEVERVKEPTAFSFQPKNHIELMEKLDWIDFERGAKVAGAKFYFSKNDLVRLNLALINYGIDVATKHGYTLMETPDLAKNEILKGIGFNPKGKGTNIYSVEGTNLSLIGTSEITVGGYHLNEVLDLSSGPLKYISLSHCYRTEAGAHGKESKGLYRVHQFTKLEMFVFCKPEDSERLHEEVLQIEQEICNGLGFPYTVVDIPTKDLGGPAYRKYDIEAWMVSKGESGGYGEITSCSNCTDYQSRRLNIRYKNENGKLQFVHTLNGTAIVTSRFPIAIVENFQDENGEIKIPEVLSPYFFYNQKNN
ncbi:Serine--tRNA ligase [Chlamydiales bacterium SCGC AB-751-O23]|jgi:seryl-tRNA synthetase|nr:Serine--tRNA ligase [Chlamydiales bacterium SCGC AB-751-O23]